MARPALTDSDGDGLPDRWEIDHALNPHDPTDALRVKSGDKWCNLIEYAFGMELGACPPNPLAVAVTGPLSASRLSVQFRRRAAPCTLQYVPEVSDDLREWRSTADSVQEIAVAPLDGRFEWVTLRDSTPVTAPGARFFRVRLIVLPSAGGSPRSILDSALSRVAP